MLLFGLGLLRFVRILLGYSTWALFVYFLSLSLVHQTHFKYKIEFIISINTLYQTPNFVQVVVRGALRVTELKVWVSSIMR